MNYFENRAREWAERLATKMASKKAEKNIQEFAQTPLHDNPEPSYGIGTRFYYHGFQPYSVFQYYDEIVREDEVYYYMGLFQSGSKIIQEEIPVKKEDMETTYKRCHYIIEGATTIPERE